MKLQYHPTDIGLHHTCTCTGTLLEPAGWDHTCNTCTFNVVASIEEGNYMYMSGGSIYMFVALTK